MTEADLSRYLGIDYGLKRIGISISDPGRTIAFAREHMVNDDKVFSKIAELVKQDCVTKIVIGLPVSLSGESNEQTEETLKFSRRLKSFLEKAEIDLAIDHIDERLTSRIAETEILESIPRKSKRRDKGKVDELSARIILQNYLDREKNLTK